MNLQTSPLSLEVDAARVEAETSSAPHALPAEDVVEELGSDAARGGHVNSRTAVTGDDGVTEVTIGRDPGGRNHVTLNDSTTLVIVRCTIETADDRDIELAFERLDDGTIGDDPPSVDSISGALQRAAQFVRNAANYYGDWTARFQAPPSA